MARTLERATENSWQGACSNVCQAAAWTRLGHELRALRPRPRYSPARALLEPSYSGCRLHCLCRCVCLPFPLRLCFRQGSVIHPAPRLLALLLLLRVPFFGRTPRPRQAPGSRLSGTSMRGPQVLEKSGGASSRHGRARGARPPPSSRPHIGSPPGGRGGVPPCARRGLHPPSRALTPASRHEMISSPSPHSEGLHARRGVHPALPLRPTPPPRADRRFSVFRTAVNTSRRRFAAARAA